jgi:hypothetical protein
VTWLAPSIGALSNPSPAPGAILAAVTEFCTAFEARTA